jgi:putative ABC transport system substrate-binding protein
VERYSAEGRADRFGELARAVVRSQPDIIVATASVLAQQLQAATDTIPIVAVMADPVAYGNVRSLARPGGNITGVSVDAGLEIWGKRLQILQEAVPTATRVGYLDTRLVWDLASGRAMREAAGKLGITLFGPPLESPVEQKEYQRVLSTMAQEHLHGLIVGDATYHLTNRRVIIELAEKARLPAIYPYREFFEIGGVMVYGSDIGASYRRIAHYVDQILRGAKPSDIPIYLESKFELLINRKAANALDLTIPASLLVRADEVIE